ncbi:S-adenosylmethionine:tRNA ribosyltransferase-isomerase [Maioricimonas rarisocia]|uniref:S-adenosylmethionine:tRNA ribosyltransferase-isomerase n=1 Tax=Maioricimonas rarisocia TaxID=2528026 RepID=A0A517Z605_9PLAN|nr:tRNA preQ1(34) S-adenosylmethionine ribosyltransferase-isomerase QueA [Maioricimonas rarisocia]QDU37861.1 S-adenosylmethionine:tRNA ribosyltransferase-isomerase [Maioricimonas rarisocia]
MSVPTADDLLSSYDYELPPGRIADQPADRRDASGLMRVDRDTGTISHDQFSRFPELIRPGDVLVVNQTRVIPARLLGRRKQTGGKWEGLFLGTDDAGFWRLIGKTRGRLTEGEAISLTAAHDPDAPELDLILNSRGDNGEWHARPSTAGGALELLEAYGTVPLPPYIQRQLATRDDWERYQTTYATRPGAVAAPTAGLHFTPEVLAECERRGATIARITLHVGIGTFRPVSAERLDDHVMHSEWCEVDAEAAQVINAAREAGGRVIAVGTTSVRTLESVAATGPLRAWQGETDLFIRPPYEFRVVDAILTNFHLPKSTLLVLVSAFAGRDLILKAYHEAVASEYRFFSYGDAMLLT